MTIAMPAPPNKTMHSLLCQQRRLSSRSLHNSGSQRSQVCVCLCSQQNPFQLSPPSSDSMRAALSVCRRRCHQITQQLGALAAQSSMSFEDQRSHGRTITLRFFFASPATAATPGFDALSLQRSVRGHSTVTSFQSCCRTPGNQETTSKTAHRITGAASSLSLTHS